MTLLPLIAAATRPGTLVRSQTGQRAEWLGVEGAEVLLRAIGGWAHGATLRRPVVEVLTLWIPCRSDA